MYLFATNLNMTGLRRLSFPARESSKRKTASVGPAGHHIEGLAAFGGKAKKQLVFFFASQLRRPAPRDASSQTTKQKTTKTKTQLVTI